MLFVRRVWILLLVAIVGCSPAKSPDLGEDVERPGQPSVTHVSSDSEKMNAAIDEARKTFGDFLKRYRANKDKDVEFQIKVLLKTGEGQEGIWSDLVSEKPTSLMVKIANKPLDDSRYKHGQVIEIFEEQVLDWMIRSEKSSEGNYTGRAVEEMKKGG